MELSLRNISKTYANGVHALDNVNLSINQGMFGLLGPNGAGKSSLMRTIVTLQTPDEGEILFNKKNILLSPQEFRYKIGYLPQDFGVYPNISAIDLMDYFARLKGIAHHKQRQQHINELLDMVNLSADKHKAVDTFSGGMRQRFGIAQTLLGNPELIIVDEPTAGLDPAERNRFYGILHQLGNNAIVILSTHIVADVTHLCKNMAILNKGKIETYGDPSNLVKELEGKLWQKSIPHENLGEHRQRYNLIATRMYQGQIQIVIQSDKKPDDSFMAKHADLEDFYFSYVSELVA